MRVLIVDDEHYIRDLLGRCLRSWGYEAVPVEDGDAAWAILKHEDAPRILIIDWDMPGLSGPEVVRLLRNTEHGEHVYIVMLTGRAKKSDLVEALEAGVDDFLMKPFNAREVELRLARAAARNNARVAKHEGSSMTVPSATTLAGRYRMERQIGEGGMADVWLGAHLALEIPIAIKFMKPSLARRPDYASFEREARAAAKLRSEHILHVYDHGIAPGGVPYLVMEYLPGESLADRVLADGPLSPEAVASIIEQMARALGSAHDRGITHADVKPENIVLLEHADWPYGLAKLVDFGLARIGAGPGQGKGLSGTPCYMSPEHLCGAEPNEDLDLWALAATAFTALTGSCAFDAPTLPALIHRVCNLPPPLASSVHPRLGPAIDAWFVRAFAKEPSQRFATAPELATSFRRAVLDAERDASFPLPARRGLAGLAATELLVEVEKESGVQHG